MTKSKLPIILVVVALAAAAGLYASGMVGGKAEGPAKKHVVEPIALADDFTINLADSGQTAMLAMNVGVQLEPMDEAHWVAFSGEGGGGHGGGGEAPGPLKVSTYPKFRDAVIGVASTFTAEQLSSGEGKADFKRALLEKFGEIAETDEAELKASASAEDTAHVGPPYDVIDVYFTKFVVQTL